MFHDYEWILHLFSPKYGKEQETHHLILEIMLKSLCEAIMEGRDFSTSTIYNNERESLGSPCCSARVLPLSILEKVHQVE